MNDIKTSLYDDTNYFLVAVSPQPMWDRSASSSFQEKINGCLPEAQSFARVCTYVYVLSS